MEGQGRAIVTYGRSLQSLAAVRSLGRQGVEVVVGDEVMPTPASLSRYAIDSFTYPSPGRDPEGFVRALDAAIDRWRPSGGDAPYVLVPIHMETYVIARHRERLNDRIRVAVPDLAALEEVRDPGRLFERASAVGVATPRTIPLRDRIEAGRIGREIGFPAFVKTKRGTAGLGVRRVADTGELLAAWDELTATFDLGPDEPPVVQEAIGGDDYCVAAIFDRGEPVTSLAYRNLRVLPKSRGSGVVRETVRAPALEAAAGRLLGSWGWHGVGEVDFRWTGRDEDAPVVLEVNPRFWSGLYHAIESGIDFPWLLFALASGRRFEPGEAVPGTRTETPLLGLLATLREIGESETHLERLRGAWSTAAREVREGRPWRAARDLATGLKDYVDVPGRLEEARRILETNHDSVYELFEAEDPLPVLGFVYPLVVFLRHGSLKREALTVSGDAP